MLMIMLMIPGRKSVGRPGQETSKLTGLATWNHRGRAEQTGQRGELSRSSRQID
ncbi:hypothetical protein EMPG_12550 [Blastomyces silverae]|uniref:Uncharacterized protein n=1 Tax=Blastomyces silverae TaxID=2060906 RepID=A0A0H1BTF6_9EURO|nr:hypothetical protein EMPG_12550 [Blastomyces silverae]